MEFHDAAYLYALRDQMNGEITVIDRRRDSKGMAKASSRRTHAVLCVEIPTGHSTCCAAIPYIQTRSVRTLRRFSAMLLRGLLFSRSHSRPLHHLVNSNVCESWLRRLREGKRPDLHNHSERGTPRDKPLQARKITSFPG